MVGREVEVDQTVEIAQGGRDGPHEIALREPQELQVGQIPELGRDRGGEEGVVGEIERLER